MWLCYSNPTQVVERSRAFRRPYPAKASTPRNNPNRLAIGRFFPSSKTCGACGLVNADLTLADRVWTCPCGVQHDRDLNAARNIDREGKRLFDLLVAAGHAETQNACGDLVRPIVRLGTSR